MVGTTGTTSSSPRPRRARLSALPALAVSVALCLSFRLLAEPIPLRDDYREYFLLAENLAGGRGFTLDGVLPYSYRPPVFSAVLAVWFLLTGSTTVTAASLLQCLLVSLSVLLSYALCFEVTKSSARSLVGAVAIAAHPSVWTHVPVVGQEPLLLLLTTLAAWQTTRWIASPSVSRAALTGLCWGLATLAKIITLFVPFLLLVFWAAHRRRRSVSVRQPTVLILVFLATLAPWTARNAVQFRRFILVNDQGMGVLRFSIARSDPRPTGQSSVLEAFMLQLPPALPDPSWHGVQFLRRLDEADMDRAARWRALWGYVKEHPRWFVAQRLRNAVYFAIPSAEYWVARQVRPSLPIWLLLFAFHLPLSVAAAAALVRSVRVADPTSRVLSALWIGCWVLNAVLWAEPRHAIPIYAVLSALASTVLPYRRG